MCGIFCKYICQLGRADETCNLHKDDRLWELLHCRGPEAAGRLELVGPNADEMQSQFQAAEGVPPWRLQLRGHTLWTQGPQPSVQPATSPHGTLLFNGDIFEGERENNISDTEELLKRLSNHKEKKDGVVGVLKKLKGPFSLVYVEKATQRLFFCRDRVGRHSLLLCRQDPHFILSSVLGRDYSNTIEVPAGHIYVFDLNKLSVKEISWFDATQNEYLSLDDWVGSLTHRQTSAPTRPLTEMLPKDIAFVERTHILYNEAECGIAFYENLLGDESTIRRVKSLLNLLDESVRVRVATQPGPCGGCVRDYEHCAADHCSLGILFSGGLDCSLLAALATRHRPPQEPIDLLNVAFQRASTEGFDVPDRLTARKSADELRHLYPSRKWNLVEINITLEELRQQQEEIISDLVFPLRTVLDESLGSALWFAARGKTPSYTSTCRVVLVGSGADELLGGYSRHRRALKLGGWAGLEQELRTDWERIASRNLARDDRVLTHHGRQPRAPYLDEDFLDFILQLNPWEKCIPSEKFDLGIGDKLLLRLAAFHLGLQGASLFPKRAIQFGSRIANKKENGNDISQRMLTVL